MQLIWDTSNVFRSQNGIPFILIGIQIICTLPKGIENEIVCVKIWDQNSINIEINSTTFALNWIVSHSSTTSPHTSSSVAKEMFEIEEVIIYFELWYRSFICCQNSKNEIYFTNFSMRECQEWECDFFFLFRRWIQNTQPINYYRKRSWRSFFRFILFSSFVMPSFRSFRFTSFIYFVWFVLISSIFSANLFPHNKPKIIEREWFKLVVWYFIR